MVILLAAVSVALVGFEVTLRLFLPQKLYRFPRHLLQNDPELVVRLRPGFQGELRNPEYRTQVRINSLGLRGPEVQAASPSTIRVLTLGDSFVSAFNVDEEETFSAILGRSLTSALPGRRVEVILGGAPGYGTWHEVRLLNRLLPEVRPDVVVLCVFVINDVQNNRAPRKTEVRNGFLVKRAGKRREILPGFLREWLHRSSMTYVFLWNAWNHLRPLAGAPTIDALGEFKALISSEEKRWLEEGYRISGDLLREFKSILAEQAIPGLVVIIPGEMQVYPEHFAHLISAEPGISLEEATERPDDRWMRLAHESELPALDLLPVFRAHAADHYLYMSVDGHLSREGNRLAGEIMGEALLPLLPRADGGSR